MPNNLRIQPMYVPNGDIEDVSLATLQQPGMLGGSVSVEYRDPGDNIVRSKSYQLVRNDSVQTVSPTRGATAWWRDADRYVVTTNPTATGRGNVAGVFTNSPTLGHYTFIQWQGRMPVVKFADTLTATPDASGMFVIPSSQHGRADCLAAGSAATYQPLGRAVGGYDSTNKTAPVDLDIPHTT